MLTMNISHLCLVFLLLTLNVQVFAGNCSFLINLFILYGFWQGSRASIKKPEAYLEPSQTSMMEFFAKIVTRY